jgi:hypothetical protein
VFEVETKIDSIYPCPGSIIMAWLQQESAISNPDIKRDGRVAQNIGGADRWDHN